MKAMLEFNLPEDESELRASIRAMEQLKTIQDFFERLRALSKYHCFKTIEEAICSIYSDYCDMMQEYL